MDEKVNLRLHNAMIEVAVCEFWEKKIAEIDWSKTGDHVFSDCHTARIKAVIKKHKARTRHRKLFLSEKRIAIVILILFSVSFVTLMSSAAVREVVYKMASQIVSTFLKENPNNTLDSDEFADYQTKMQIEQLESGISDALSVVGLPQNTGFQIHVDGWLNVTISGLDEDNAAKIKPYIEPMAGILSSAYASENKNQLYYVQSVIFADEAIKDETADDYSEAKIENRRIIREYMLANDVSSTNEIMKQTRNISFANGKLVFEGK